MGVIFRDASMVINDVWVTVAYSLTVPQGVDSEILSRTRSRVATPISNVPRCGRLRSIIKNRMATISTPSEQYRNSPAMTRRAEGPRKKVDRNHRYAEKQQQQRSRQKILDR